LSFHATFRPTFVPVASPVCLHASTRPRPLAHMRTCCQSDRVYSFGVESSFFPHALSGAHARHRPIDAAPTRLLLVIFGGACKNTRNHLWQHHVAAHRICRNEEIEAAQPRSAECDLEEIIYKVFRVLLETQHCLRRTDNLCDASRHRSGRCDHIGRANLVETCPNGICVSIEAGAPWPFGLNYRFVRSFFKPRTSERKLVARISLQPKKRESKNLNATPTLCCFRQLAFAAGSI